jgi:tripartite-type tricarboxylate transporter receptor subunit TctC
LTKRLEEIGLMPSQLSPQAFGESMQADFQKWRKMIQAGNIHVE